jgi:ABC-2 type transport system ATP-binding protein
LDYAIDVQKVVKAYSGATRNALDGVTLQVLPGRIFAILGPNGAGKTSLMRILTTQIDPTSGSAHILGLNVFTDGQKVRRLTSYVPQEMSVWTDITAYENLFLYSQIYGIPKEERIKQITDALERMDLTNVEDNLVNTFSGGMIRRLEIACALIVKPKVIFLDEPTIGLDPVGRKKVWEKLVSFTRESGATVFFSTHYMDEADLYADEIAIINAGKIVGQGNSEMLKATVGNQELVIHLASGKLGKNSITALKRVSSVIQSKVSSAGDLEIWVKDADTALPQVMMALDSTGAKVASVKVNKPSLEDAFAKYAGKTFEDDDRLKDVKNARKRIMG